MRYKEDDLQMATAQYLDVLGVLWTHVANERRVKPQAGKRLKLKGVKSGVPDCMIFEARNGFNGLAIELKIEQDNGFKKNGEPKKKTKTKLTGNQKRWLCDLSARGWSCCVCYNLDEVIKKVQYYLKKKNRPCL